MKTIALLAIFAVFTAVAIGLHYDYKKSRRRESLVQAILIYVFGLCGLFSKSFVVFFCAFVVSGIVGYAFAYRGKKLRSADRRDV